MFISVQHSGFECPHASDTGCFWGDTGGDYRYHFGPKFPYYVYVRATNDLGYRYTIRAQSTNDIGIQLFCHLRNFVV